LPAPVLALISSYQVEVFIGSPSTPYIDHTVPLSILVAMVILVLYAFSTAGAAWVMSRGSAVKFVGPERSERTAENSSHHTSFQIGVLNTGRSPIRGAVVKIAVVSPEPREWGLPEAVLPLAEFDVAKQMIFVLRPGETRWLRAIEHSRVPSGNDFLGIHHALSDGGIPRLQPTTSYAIEFRLYGEDIARPFRQRARIEILDRVPSLTL
jgi:hypothetical protein